MDLEPRGQVRQLHALGFRRTEEGVGHVAGGRGDFDAALFLGFVGAGGLGQMMDSSMKMFNGSEVATMLLVFMALVALADRVSAWLRRALG